MRDSKFGKALVLETFTRAGGYILGFRVDPVGRLDDILKECKSLHTLFAASPVFGVDFVLEADAPHIQQLMQPRIEEDSEIVHDSHQDSHAVAAYYAEDSAAEDEASRVGGLSLDPRLGLAIEALPEGITTQLLWTVI